MNDLEKQTFILKALNNGVSKIDLIQNSQISERFISYKLSQSKEQLIEYI